MEASAMLGKESSSNRVATRLIIVSVCGMILSYAACCLGLYLERKKNGGTLGTVDLLGGAGVALSAIVLAVGILMKVTENGLKKASALFASVLILCLGLCAGNFALYSHSGSSAGSGSPTDHDYDAALLYLFTGTLELLGMLVGLVGLVATGLISLSLWARKKTAYSGGPTANTK